jgi:hypothetical protein
MTTMRAIGGAWAIRLLRDVVLPDCVLLSGDTCLAEIRGRRVRVYSERSPRGWEELDGLVCGVDYDVAPSALSRRIVDPPTNA